MAEAIGPFVPTTPAKPAESPASLAAYEQWLAQRAAPPAARATPVAAAPTAPAVPTAVAVPVGAPKAVPAYPPPVAAYPSPPTAAPPAPMPVAPAAMAVPAYGAPTAVPAAYVPAYAPAPPAPEPIVPAVGPSRSLGAQRRNASRHGRKNAMFLVAALATIVLVGVGAVLFLPGLLDPGDVAETDTDSPTTEGGTTPPDGGGTTENSTENGAAGAPGTGTGNSGDGGGESTPVPAAEQLVAVDGDVWQSPTHGEPLDLRYFPVGVQMFLALRPAELLAHPEGPHVLAALGPLGEQVQATLKSLGGIEPAEMEQAILGVIDAGHDNEPALALVVRTREPADVEALKSAWGELTEETISDRKVFTGSQRVYFVPEEGEGRVWASVPLLDKPFMEEWLKDADKARYPRAEVAALVRSTDAARHCTLLFASRFWFDPSKGAFPGPTDALRVPLENFLLDKDDQRPEAGIVSLHLTEDAFFAELRLYLADKLPQESAQGYLTRTRELSGAVEDHLITLKEQDYGRKVLRQFPDMIEQLGEFTTAGLEDRQAVLRAYLPAIAAHNLALGTQLAVLETRGGASAAATTGGTSEPTYKDVADKLAKMKISLVFAPDTLENCMKMFGDEVGVEVKILGNDLEAEGITKNQRFPMDSRDLPAGEVLRTALTKATPAGKPPHTLIYVIQQVDGKEQIQITTQTAAKTRGDKIPAEFTVAATASTDN
jgi:hypothetical protein